MKIANVIDYSIIIPVYFNAGELHHTFSEIKRTVVNANPNRIGEIIFVNDGSTDDSLRELLDIYNANKGLVRVLDLTRNWGQYAAKWAGHQFARGSIMLSLSADLQDPPELMNEMLRAHDQGADLCIATRKTREESIFRKLTSLFYYKLVRHMNLKNMPKGGFDYHSMSRRVLEQLRPEHNTNWQHQLIWTGFDWINFPYARQARIVNKSRWTTTKKLKLMLNVLTSYSAFPFSIAAIFGTGLMVLTALHFLFLIFGGSGLIGLSRTLLLFASGLILFTLAALGIYVWHAFLAVVNRPIYIIENTWE